MRDPGHRLPGPPAMARFLFFGSPLLAAWRAYYGPDASGAHAEESAMARSSQRRAASCRREGGRSGPGPGRGCARPSWPARPRPARAAISRRIARWPRARIAVSVFRPPAESPPVPRSCIGERCSGRPPARRPSHTTSPSSDRHRHAQGEGRGGWPATAFKGLAGRFCSSRAVAPIEAHGTSRGGQRHQTQSDHRCRTAQHAA